MLCRSSMIRKYHFTALSQWSNFTKRRNEHAHKSISVINFSKRVITKLFKAKINNLALSTKAVIYSTIIRSEDMMRQSLRGFKESLCSHFFSMTRKISKMQFKLSNYSSNTVKNATCSAQILEKSQTWTLRELYPRLMLPTFG